MSRYRHDLKTESIEKIGIPKAFLYFRYGIFWEVFLSGLGFDVVVSEDTTRATLDAGEAISVDETCLASKIFLGHVADLADRCDAVFIPSFECANHRAGFCTKFNGLPDIVFNTFRDREVEVLTLCIEDVTDVRKTRDAYIAFARDMGASKREAALAYKRAKQAHEKAIDSANAAQAETIRLLRKYKGLVARDETGTEEAPLSIMLVAHPYVSHDAFLARDIIEPLEDMNAYVLYADRCDRKKAFKKSFEFSETLPWIINRELIGSLLSSKDDIDGIIAVSSFPCGPDSMFCDALIRYVDDMPILNLIIDGQNGRAGLQTRIESFIDILRYKQKGGYMERARCGQESEMRNPCTGQKRAE